MVNLFAGFRQVFERRMILGVSQIEANSLLADKAHKAFAYFQFGFVNSRALQALGGVELKNLPWPHHIDGAHLGHHIGRNQTGNFIEPLLCCLRLRHDLAEPPKQDTRA
jgi:hypothetical protein